jgi:hypothetical protein
VTKYLREINTKETRSILALSFRGFSPGMLCLVAFWPVVRHWYIMAEVHDGRKQTGSKRKERNIPL